MDEVAVAVLDAAYLTFEIVSNPLHLVATTSVVRLPMIMIVPTGEGCATSAAVGRVHYLRSQTGEQLGHHTEAELHIWIWTGPRAVLSGCRRFMTLTRIHILARHLQTLDQLSQKHRLRLTAPLASQP